MSAITHLPFAQTEQLHRTESLLKYCLSTQFPSWPCLHTQKSDSGLPAISTSPVFSFIFFNELQSKSTCVTYQPPTSGLHVSMQHLLLNKYSIPQSVLLPIFFLGYSGHRLV